MGIPEPTARDAAAHCACLKARMAARAVSRRYDAALRPLGLRTTQFTLLSLLAVAADGTRAMTITAAAARLGMDRTTLSRNLVPLARRGLVAVGPEGPRRARELGLTAAGARMLAAALPVWAAAQAALRDDLGGQTWDAMQDALTRAARAGPA